MQQRPWLWILSRYAARCSVEATAFFSLACGHACCMQGAGVCDLQASLLLILTHCRPRPIRLEQVFVRRAPPLIGRLVETFSFLAVGTSFIGTTLSLSGEDGGHPCWFAPAIKLAGMLHRQFCCPAALCAPSCAAYRATLPVLALCRDAADRGASAAARGV